MTIQKTQSTKGLSTLKYLNILIIFTCFGIAALWTIFWAIVIMITFPLNERRGHDFHRIWAKGWLGILGIQVELFNRENLPTQGAVVLAPNHQSMFDIFLMSALPINFKYIAKKEVGRIPLVGWTLKVMGTYWVKRDKTGKDLLVMRKVEQNLQHGVSVLIFPEGTRSRTGQLLPLRKGAFRTACNAGVPICPIAITGTFEIAPPKKLPSRWGHRVRVRIGKPQLCKPGESLEFFMREFLIELTRLLEANKSS